MQYGPTIENFVLIVEKAKTKNNGVYTFRGVTYLVKNNRVTHYASGGKILERYGYFDTQIGTYDRDSDAVKFLKSL